MRTTAILVGSVAATLAAGSALAQTRTQNLPVSWQFRKSNVAVVNGQLRLVLTQTARDSDWIVGVRAEANATDAQIVVGKVTFSQPRASELPVRIITEIVDWPATQVKMQPGVVEAIGLREPVGALLVFLAVPRGTSVSLNKDGTVVLQASVIDSLMLYNGNIVPERIVGVSSIIQRLIHPTRRQDSTELIRGPNGDYVAMRPGVRSHAVALRKPEHPDRYALSKRTAEVLLRIKIDETGRVVDVIDVSGPDPFLKVARSALWESQFRPFTANGTAVPVMASIIFQFHGDGAVTSPDIQ